MAFSVYGNVSSATSTFFHRVYKLQGNMYAKRRIMDVMSIQLARRIAQRLRRGCPLTCVSPDDMPSKRGGLMGRKTRWQASPASQRSELRSSGDGAAHKPELVKLKPAPSKPRTPASDTQRSVSPITPKVVKSKV